MRAISRENRKHYLSNVLAQTDLLPTVRREVEHEDGEEADAHAGDDEVDGVEESLPPHGDVEGDVQVGLVAAGVELHIPEMYESYILQNHFLGSHIAILLSLPTNTTTITLQLV